MRVFATPALSVSRWQLTPAERDEIDRTGCIWVAILDSTGLHPPMVMGTEDEVRSVAADYGPVWPKDGDA